LNRHGCARRSRREVTATQTLLVALLALNAALVFGYRVYRLAKGGPMADVAGGAVLALLLAAISIGVAVDFGAARWAALGYGLLFAVVVMPVWTLAVLIPLPPRWPDYAFTVLYWVTLVAIVAVAIVL
jgi:hypothetical protein